MLFTQALKSADIGDLQTNVAAAAPAAAAGPAAPGGDAPAVEEKEEKKEEEENVDMGGLFGGDGDDYY